MPSVGKFSPGTVVAEIMTEFDKVKIISVPVTLNKNKPEIELWVTEQRYQEAVTIVNGIEQEHPQDNDRDDGDDDDDDDNDDDNDDDRKNRKNRKNGEK